jgi:hypothetical protein
MKSTLFTFAFLTLTLPAFGQGVDPLIGTWKLNVEKSVNSIPLQRSMTITWWWKDKLSSTIPKVWMPRVDRSKSY